MLTGQCDNRMGRHDLSRTFGGAYTIRLLDTIYKNVFSHVCFTLPKRLRVCNQYENVLVTRFFSRSRWCAWDASVAVRTERVMKPSFAKWSASFTSRLGRKKKPGNPLSMCRVVETLFPSVSRKKIGAAVCVNFVISHKEGDDNGVRELHRDWGKTF